MPPHRPWKMAVVRSDTRHWARETHPREDQFAGRSTAHVRDWQTLAGFAAPWPETPPHSERYAPQPLPHRVKRSNDRPVQVAMPAVQNAYRAAQGDLMGEGMGGIQNSTNLMAFQKSAKTVTATKTTMVGGHGQLFRLARRPGQAGAGGNIAICTKLSQLPGISRTCEDQDRHDCANIRPVRSMTTQSTVISAHCKMDWQLAKAECATHWAISGPASA